ncbi:probable ubiquitin-conjugating enzyme E2 23 [Triticum dicoccoides]|uniref:probable ubiquitin-conjugating enzyme E2 23 n=1 Tax=Triticum dicoccoides TaxID=85692 RepID=UPI0018918504|nr:probable ubiquitin-conjugating enzyme E2 23 [Triticum dicoccoides]
MDATEEACVRYTNLYWLDLVSSKSARGNEERIFERGLVVPLKAADADSFMTLGINGALVSMKGRDMTIVDRSCTYVGQMVVSGSDVGGQMGVVVGVSTTLDLLQLNVHGEATKTIRGVRPSGLRRVRALSLGDYVVSGQWLGRVVQVFLDVDVVFDDGAVCKVTDAEPKKLRAANTVATFRPQMNCAFYSGEQVTGDRGDPSAVFRESQWLDGSWKPEHEVGSVSRVEMVGVLVYWVASAHGGTDEQVLEMSAPSAYQNPNDLTFFCSSSDCTWGLGDRCFLITKTDDDTSDHHHQDESLHALPTMTVSSTHTIVDVLWQDGTRQHRAPSISLNPSECTNEHEFFPGQYVVDNAPVDVTFAVVGDDDVVSATDDASTRRVGVVRSLNSNDHTVQVSWIKANNEAGNLSLEVECGSTTASAYDLSRDPDHSVFYGDIVVHLLSSVAGSRPAVVVQQPQAPADLSWVGQVVNLCVDGHVQVKWGDGTTSMVLPHEISVVNKDNYTQLQAEMDNWAEEDAIVDDPQELGAANVHNDPTDTTSVEGDDGSVDELDGHAAVIMQNLAQASAGSHEDPSVGGAATEYNIADLAARSDASVDASNSDTVEDVVKVTDATGDDDHRPFNLPHFDVVQSPPDDHHYLDTTDQGSTGKKRWVKTVQKEWKILENSLPDGIYVRAFEGRMDLLRVVMVGASGTPYQDGLFFFDMQLPPSYPAVPPQVYYHSFGLHLNPNLYPSGTVCLSLLNTFDGEGTEVWSPGTSSLLQVVVSLQALVLNDQPYYNEASLEALIDTPEGHRNALPYCENAFLLSSRTMLHLVRRPPQGFEGFVKDHFRRRGRYVLRMCEAYLKGCVPVEEGGMELPCSAGFNIALANVVPRLMAAFTKVGDEGSDLSSTTTQ